MLTAPYYDTSGREGDAFPLPQDPFDGVVHDAALYQVVKAHLANRRQGTSASRSRGEVSGGSRKIWRQKGTGRARQGTIRAPHWRGGGAAFGPSPRSYRQAVPKRVKQLARRSALNERARGGKLAVIEGVELEAPRTKAVVELLGSVGAGEASVLILTREVNRTLVLSARNLPQVEVMPYEQASAYDILCARFLVIEAGALDTGAAAEDAPPAQAEAAVETEPLAEAETAAATGTESEEETDD